MDNNFDVNKYFTANFGLGDKPAAGKLNMKLVIIGAILIIAFVAIGIAVTPALIAGAALGVIVIVIPVIKFSKSNGKAKEWQKNHDERYRTWDAELEKFYDKTVASMNLKETAMNKIGIDEADVKEVEPFSIHGSDFDGWYRKGADGKIRTDNREITWLFFSKDQVYIYNVKFSLTGRIKKYENTQEFFYSDIVSVSTGTQSVQLNKSNSIDGVDDYSTESEAFNLIVPGDKMTFAFTTTDTISRSIQAMKTKIREKKNK